MRSRRARRRRQSNPSAAHRVLEVLERRSLLTMLTSEPRDFLAENVNQFGGGDALVINEDVFLGAAFDTGNRQFGGYVDSFGLKTGARADLRLHGRAGFDVGFFINSGSVDADFDDVSVQQQFADPLTAGEQIDVETLQELLGGSFETISPTLGAYTDLVFELAGHAKLNARVLDSGSGLTVGGPFNVADIDQELFAFNRDNDRQVRVLGQSVNPADELKISTPVSKVPPVSLELVGSPIPNQLGMTETVNVVFGDVLNRPKVEQQKAGTKYPELDVGVELATFSQSIPYVGLQDQSLSNGSLSAVSERSADTLIADMNVHLGRLVNPAFGKFNLSVGPASLSVTPLSFTTGPALHAWQSVQITPTSTLTWDFDRETRFRLEGGAWQTDTSVTFPAGADLDVEFDGSPVEVSPTWHFDAQMHNRIAIDVSLLGKLKVGELEFDIDVPNPVKEALGLPASIGPLYEETVSFANHKFDMYNETFSILSESTRLPSFVIGGNTDPDLQVISKSETGTNSLRRAIRSANLIDADEGANGADTENVIFLGTGTYELSTAIDTDRPDAETGDLDVTDRNLRIVGVGPDETVIDANQIDRVLQVHPGASLTLENLTLTGGDSNFGGGVINYGALKLVNVKVDGNEVSGHGGGIYNGGQLTVEDTNISNNTAGGLGGGVYTFTDADFLRTQLDSNDASGNWAGGLYVGGGNVTFDRGAIVRNTVSASGGGAFVQAGELTLLASTVSGNRAGSGTSGAGGGVYTNNSGSLVVSQSTITSNTAGFGGGVRIVGTGGLSVQNSIIADNTASNSSYSRWRDGRVDSGLLTDLGHNLIGRTDSQFSFAAGTNVLNVSPQLSMLGRYGGQTESHILKPGSPAIDAGSAGTPVDQRDFMAGTGTRDIGSTQFFDSATVETTSDDRGLTLRAAINVFNVVGGSNTIQLGPGVYELTDRTEGDLDIRNQTLTITGAGQGATVIDASGVDDRVFSVESAFGGNTAGTLLLEDLTVTGGRLTSISNQSGAGISNRGTLSLNRVTVSGNSTDWLGGGIYNFGTLTIASSTLADNRAGDAGGGLYDESQGTLTIRDSTISGNAVVDTRPGQNPSTPREARGGGLYVKNGTVSIDRTTISGNQAVGLDVPGQSNGLGEGGGLWLWKADVEVRDTTIFNNTAATSTFWQNSSGERVQEDSEGGGLYIQRSDGRLIRLTNSILAGNSAADGPDVWAFRNENGSSTLTSGGHNLIGNVGDPGDPDADFTASDVVGDRLVPVDPRLGPLADHGGDSRTHEPLANSPAIDSGQAVFSIDQRGLDRPIGIGDDIGAVESAAVFVDIPEREDADDDHAVSPDGTAGRSLRKAIADANTIPGPQELRLPEGRYVLDLAGAGNSSPLTGDLDVLDDLTIIGAGAGRTIIDASALGDRAFDVAAGVTLTFDGVTIIGGQASGGQSEADGGAIRSAGTLELFRSHVTDGRAAGQGGNIASDGTLRMENSAVTDGRAANGGGGIAVFGTAFVDHVTVAGNEAAIGGGLLVDAADAVLTLTASTVTDNSADHRGGGLAVDAGTAAMKSTLIDRNSAPAAPDVSGHVTSAGYNLFGNSAGLTGAVPTDRRDVDSGLAIDRSSSGIPSYWLRDGSPAIDAVPPENWSSDQTDQNGNPRQLGSQIDIGAVETLVVSVSETSDGNQSGTLRRAVLDANRVDGLQQINLAAGTYVLDLTGSDEFTGDLDISDPLRIVGEGAEVTVIDASALGDRAFDVLAESSLQLVGVSVIGGSADEGGNIRNAGRLSLLQVGIGAGTAASGGGIASLPGSELVVESSTLYDNTSTGEGGGIFNEGSLSAVNLTLSGNNADVGGGLRTTGAARLINVTIADNDASVRGGGISNAAAGVVTIANAIVAQNTAPAAPDADGTFISGVWQDPAAPRQGHNAIGDVSGSTGFGQVGDLLGVDPQLGPLQSTGGFPVRTQSPQSGSPVIDAGRSTWEWTAGDETQTVTAPATDQPGYARQGETEIGATEYRGDPELLAPDDTTREQRPLMSWSPVTDALEYEVWIKNQSTGENPFVRATVTEASYTPDADLGIGRFNLWVRAIHSNGPGAWTSQRNFVINERLEVHDPGRRQTTHRPTLTWDAMPGAVRYDVWIDDKAGGVSQYVRDEHVSGTSWQPSSDLPLGLYHAWVRGIAADGTPGGWSRTTVFYVMPAPNVTQGHNHTFDRTPTFAWDALPGATHYEVFVRDRITGATTLYEQNIAGLSFTPGADLPDGPYRWWAIGVSDDNVRSYWTDPIDIFVGGRTELLSPGGTTSDTTPEFTWRTVDGAARYDLWVDHIGGQSQIIREQNLNEPRFTALSPLPSGNYRAWVRAVSTSGEVSPWSLQHEFAIGDGFASWSAFETPGQDDDIDAIMTLWSRDPRLAV